MVMKKYDKLFAYVLVCIAAACFGILFGCRSTKGAVEETTIQEVSESSADSTFNAAATAEKTKETRADSSNVRADERGRVEIERDSAGRPTVIIWNYDWRLHGANTMQTEKCKWFYGLNATRHSEASGKTDTDTKKKKETKTEVDPSIPLETLIGTALLGFTVLYVIYVIIADHVWPWIKNRRQ